ncbi:RDD family protein [Acidaminobacter sp.]|uniref:RDD family protein n=1 Tax=Acidaminobacter sp. TaxID=1872102 RepID=UPI001381AE3A|nr:RDD family protein [Acidaminobacter sp.]MDK9709966.1 RDD family protein [Acidaminobacter sp.]MZQ98821.1 hypothetical protein [Acidaminobacter sp.]
MTTRTARPIRRIEAFLLELLTWGSVVYAFDRIMDRSLWISGFWLGILVMTGLNFYLMTKATTLGKYILDMKIIDRRTGRDLTFVRMLLRETIGKAASALILMIGFIWIIIDNETAGWHDKLFHSQVVEMVQIKRVARRSPDDDEFFVRG